MDYFRCTLGFFSKAVILLQQFFKALWIPCLFYFKFNTLILFLFVEKAHQNCHFRQFWTVTKVYQLTDCNVLYLQ